MTHAALLEISDDETILIVAYTATASTTVWLGVLGELVYCIQVTREYPGLVLFSRGTSLLDEMLQDAAIERGTPPTSQTT